MEGYDRELVNTTAIKHHWSLGMGKHTCINYCKIQIKVKYLYHSPQNTKTNQDIRNFMMFLLDESNSDELATSTCDITPHFTDTIGLLLNLEEEILYYKGLMLTTITSLICLHSGEKQE